MPVWVSWLEETPKDERKQSPEGSTYTCLVKEGKPSRQSQNTGNSTSFNKTPLFCPVPLLKHKQSSKKRSELHLL